MPRGAGCTMEVSIADHAPFALGRRRTAAWRAPALLAWMTLACAVSLAIGMGEARGEGASGASVLFTGVGSSSLAGSGNLAPLSPATVATPGSEPVSIIVSPDGKSAYVGPEHGSVVTQFSRDSTTGKLTALSPATVTAGSEPRELAISPDGKYVYAADFGGSMITTLSRSSETGKLTVSGSTITTGTNPHGIGVSADGKSVYAANFNGESVSQFSRNTETGALTALSPATVAAGVHPNGIAISADGKSVYTSNRGGGTVSQYARNTSTGALTPMSPATAAAGGNPHDVAVSSDGKNVYVPNAAETTGTESVSQFGRNTSTGALTPLSPATVAPSGEPRGVTVSPDGASVYVAQGTKELVAQFSRDSTTGALTSMSPASVTAGKHSYSVAVSPDGQSAYVTNEGGGSVSQYSRATAVSGPTVATEPASAVAQSSATLNGSVNPNGGEVSECKLEYGTSTSYGSSASCVPSPGSGSSPVAVSASITGLTANTTYHFRVVAKNSGGTSAGSDVTFTTLPNPPTAVTEPASGVAQTSATLNGSVNPNGGQVTECKLEYGTSTAYGSSAACVPSPGAGSSPVAVSASITGLTANTTYHFRVVAKNSGGTSAGGDATLKTLPNAPTVVTEPASGLAQTSATLNGSVNPNGGEVSECKLEYGTSTAYGSSAACTPSPGAGSSAVAVSASITGLTANTTYHFRVVAKNAGGTSAGSDATLKTLPNAPTVVTEPASGVAQTSATLNGSVNPNGGEVSECKLEYGTSTSYGASAPCTPSPGSGSSAVAVSASITGLTANTTYHFRVVATNAGGTSFGADASLKTSAESADGCNRTGFWCGADFGDVERKR